MKVYFIVLGSSTDSCRFEFGTGNALADGWSEPFWQKSGFLAPRPRAANQTRPWRSNMALWLLVLVSQMASVPQYADGCMIVSLAA